DGIGPADVAAWVGTAHRTYSTPTTEAGKDAYRWTAAIDPSGVAGAPGVPRALGTLRGLEVLTRGRSGRATAVRLTGAKKTIKVEGELKIRRALGGLKSSMFVVERDRDRYGRIVLRGGGHGHGVGLCQHGAMGMAKAGKGYREILAHYYSGAVITKLW
ncbi:MAG: stage II sporulation protein SpoIID, partial [Myxococcota bacterium]